MRIAILDSGVDKNIIKVEAGMNFVNNRSEDYYDENGHGTCCASLIKYLCPQANLFPVKILNGNLLSSSSILINALEYLLDEDKIDIVHMSLSTPLNSDKLSKIIKKLKDRGIILISSYSNNKSIESFPAQYGTTIGVMGSLFERDQYWFDLSAMTAVCNKIPSFALSRSGHYVLFSGNSKAAALFTGLISQNNKDNVLSLKKIVDGAVRTDWSSDELISDINEVISKDEDKNFYYLAGVVSDFLNCDSEKVLRGESLFQNGLTPYNAFSLLRTIEQVYDIKLNPFAVDARFLWNINGLNAMINNRYGEEP